MQRTKSVLVEQERSCCSRVLGRDNEWPGDWLTVATDRRRGENIVKFRRPVVVMAFAIERIWEPWRKNMCVLVRKLRW